MGTLLHDLRFAVRLLRKSPVFTAVAVLTLALAIAANTVIFTGVNAVLLQPLPYAQPDQLVRVYTQFPRQNLAKFYFSTPEYFDLQRETRTLTSIGAWYSSTANFSGSDQPVSVPRTYVTATLFQTLGVRPALGRGFAPEEDLPNGPNVVVISYDLWQSAFRGTADVLGKTVQINGRTTAIVGVMPQGFDYPGNGTQVWTPLGLDPADQDRGSHNYNVIGRMKPGVTLDAANADLRDLATHWLSGVAHMDHSIDPVRHPIVARSLKAEIVESATKPLWLMQGVVLFVLLIACANVSNLLVARADVRRGEIAMRVALGAGRIRLARQFMVESIVLGLCGGLVGLLLTPWALHAMLHLLPDGTPRAREIHIDGAVLGFAVASAILASLVFGLAPIVHSHSRRLQGVLASAANRATGGKASIRIRRALIVAEIALATVLVVGAGLFARSFIALQRVDLGFVPQNLVIFTVTVPSATVRDDASLVRFYGDLRDRLVQIPGVQSVSAVSSPPPNRFANMNDIYFPGETQDPNGPTWNVDYWQFAVGEHVATLGGRIVAGRALGPGDDEHGQLVALVNEAFVRKFWPGQNAVGKRIRAVDEKDPDVTIVGVVADMKYGGVDHPSGSEIIFPLAQYEADSQYNARSGMYRQMTYLLRTRGDTRAVFASARSTLAAFAPTIPAAQMRTMEDAVWEDVAQPRFLTALVLGFALIALLMAVVGVYGVMSYAVVQRSQEIGIRMALGAPAGRVVRMLLEQGAALAATGIVIGLGLSFALQRVLAHTLEDLLYGSSGLDWTVLVLVVLPLASVALFACWVPARRASRIPPTLAMRAEA
jgi:putative ABC transport system permease protein